MQFIYTPTLIISASTFTKDNDVAVGYTQNSFTTSPRCSVLLEDVHVIQKRQRFACKYIPKCVVNTRGKDA